MELLAPAGDEERLEAARQAAYLWNIGKVIHNGMCD